MCNTRAASGFVRVTVEAIGYAPLPRWIYVGERLVSLSSGVVHTGSSRIASRILQNAYGRPLTAACMVA